MNARKGRKTIAACCLLMLFIGYQTAVTAFMHVHFFDYARLVHYHPFSDTHTHSEESLVVIGNIVLGGDTLEVEAQEIQLPPLPLFAVLTVGKATPTIKGEAGRVVSLRAPPQLG